jgi:molecular chaperone GrpE
MKEDCDEAGAAGTEPDGEEHQEDHAPSEQGGDEAAHTARQEWSDPSAALQRLQAENKELKDKNLQLLTEMAAYRQRLDRDKEEFKKYAISGFAGDMLAVADNICRALEAVPRELLGTIPALKGITDGVEATERIFLNALNRHGVTRFIPLGEPFNPHIHDAKAMVNIPDVPAKTIIHVICAGYMIGERVLRPAEVAVAQGGNTASHRAPPAEEALDDEHAVVLFRRPGLNASGADKRTPSRERDQPRKSSILQKAIIASSDGIPAATHPVWERLVTGQINHRFKMFAANLLVDRAKREYASNRGAKARLASEICTFCNRYASLMASDLEPVVSTAGRIPAASHPVWEQLLTGRIRHRFRLFAANLLIDRTRREYASNGGARARLIGELHKFFNEHADLTASEFEIIASEETSWVN